MKISIITAVYNNALHIENAISSVISQTYNNIEHIIIDGASNDGTLEIINNYQNKISRIISGKDKGIYDALNKGIRLATGDIVGILHSDDLFNNEYVLEKVAAKIERENCDGLYGDLIYVDKYDTNKVIRYWKSGEYKREYLERGWMPPHPTLFIRKSIYDQYNLFNQKYKIAADYELILRFLKQREISLTYLPEVIVKMRTGGKSNKSIKNILKKTTEDYQALKANEFSSPLVTLALKNICKIPQFFTTPSQKVQIPTTENLTVLDENL